MRPQGGMGMVEVAGIWHVYDFTPEELELIYHALRYYRFWVALETEQKNLAMKIADAIETYLRD